ncbi:MAG: flavin reductase [Planctomycetota bacterium]
MAHVEVDFRRDFEAVMHALGTRGLLLGSYDARGKANFMTIGWGVLGIVWGLPMWVVLVRPSRYTFGCIERTGFFSVNVPTKGMEKTCAVCGSKSGRDMDKVLACKLTVEKGSYASAPVILECPIVYECKVVHSTDVIPERLAEEVRAEAYPKGDYHRLYFGKILATRAEADPGSLLAK